MIQAILKWLEKPSTTPKAAASTTDVLKAIRVGLTLAIAQGVISALESFATTDLGPYKALATPLLAFAVDFVRRWATDNAAK